MTMNQEPGFELKLISIQEHQGYRIETRGVSGVQGWVRLEALYEMQLSDILARCGKKIRNHGDNASHAPWDEILFFDIESSGLSKGATLWCVGVGQVTSKGVEIQQWVLTDINDYRAYLEGLWSLFSRAKMVVSYNGLWFDERRLREAFEEQGWEDPFQNTVHLDLFKIIEREDKQFGAKWRMATQARNLKLPSMEEAIVGFVRVGDVPGSEAPKRWQHFLDTGDAGPLEPLIHHNCIDILSLASILGGLVEGDKVRVATSSVVKGGRPQHESDLQESDLQESGLHKSKVEASKRLKEKKFGEKEPESHAEEVPGGSSNQVYQGDSPFAAMRSYPVDYRLKMLRERAEHFCSKEQFLKTLNYRDALSYERTLLAMVAMSPFYPFALGALSSLYEYQGDETLAQHFKRRWACSIGEEV